MLRYCQTLEVHTDFATLYLRGSLGHTDVELVRAMCSRLPATIRVLRLDATGLEALDAAMRDSLNALVADWRRERKGQVIVAGARRDTSANGSELGAQTDAPAQAGSALMATFL